MEVSDTIWGVVERFYEFASKGPGMRIADKKGLDVFVLAEFTYLFFIKRLRSAPQVLVGKV